MTSKQTHAFLIWLIRIIPMLASLYVFSNSVEVLYSIHAEDYVEYYDGDKLLYIVYNSPVSDFLAGYISVSWLTIVLMFSASYAFKFCAYHRVFIWYILAYKLCAEITQNIIFEEAHSYMASISIIGFGIMLAIALYLHQKYGDRTI